MEKEQLLINLNYFLSISNFYVDNADNFKDIVTDTTEFRSLMRQIIILSNDVFRNIKD